jgi:diadenylate cyclase
MTQLTLLLREFLTWQAFLDIALITAALFFLYRTVVRLGTWKIVLGILSAFVVFAVAKILNLEGIEWIFQNVSHVAVIALIVIFQPELRKLLERVASLKKTGGSAGSDEQHRLIAQGLLQMAAQRQGAILVYPGKEPIEEKLSGGIVLSAEPSLPLLLSIFDPNSPGHDGAVIINDQKLSRFGVRLPMSQTTRLSQEYGTRHHAAMGLAEQTDALVLVVSEERGLVSAFREGAMQPLASLEEIVATIKKHTAEEKFLDIDRLGLLDRRTILPLLASLAIATIFSTTLITVNRQVVSKALTLPVEYGSPSDGLMLVDDRPQEVRVQLAGPKSELDTYIASQPTVKLDLKEMVEGKQTVLLSRDNLQLPARVTLVESKPEQLMLHLAVMVKRSVKVVPQLVGILPDHLKIKQIKVVPSELQVMMPPPKRGEKPPTLTTTPVYLNAVEEENRVFCKIIAPPSVQPVTRPWQDVEVIVDIAPIDK